MDDIKDVKFGTNQVQRVYAGDSLIFEHNPPDTVAPITSMRPYDQTNNPNRIYDSAQTVWFDVNETSDTYFTTDGSTPTTASRKYEGDGIPIENTTTFKYFSVDQAGNTEPIKTTTYTINVAPVVTSYRYIRFIGYGDNTNTATTRLVELQAMHGSVNRLLNKVPISGEPVNAGGSIETATDGIVAMTSGTYPIWWMGAGIPTLTYDLGDWFAIDSLKLWMFSTEFDPRQPRFILQVSTDNTNWTTVANYQNNTTVQPTDGWTFSL